MTALIILNEEINNIMKIIESLQEPSSLIKGVSKKMKMKRKNKKVDFLACYQINQVLVNQ